MRIAKMNKSIILLVVMSFTFFGCNTEKKKKDSNPEKNEAQAGTEENQEWKILFDGNTFDGWRGLGRDFVPEEHWRIEDATIRKLNSGLVPSLPDGQPAEGGDLMTIASFDNYELYFEWKISKAGNSGIKYNVSEEMSQKYDSKYSALGFEYQLLDDGDIVYADLKASHFSGSLYDMIPASNVTLKPVGEFNTSRILVNGNQAEHWLNGVKVLEFEFGSNRLHSLYKNSKYRDYPSFHEKRKGHIVLQNHKDDAWFRNIRIREIKSN